MDRISHVGPWLVDATGRVVQLHGLTSYQKKPPFLDDMSDADLDYAVGEGFNAFRINWVWQALEPQPGHFNTGYLGDVVALNERMAQRGIRTLIGPAQNFYSAKYMGFGAPGWASINHKLCQGSGEDAVCVKQIDMKLSGSDAELEAWDNFYANAPAPDGVGVLTHFMKSWQLLARGLAASRNVYALDLLHEPTPGLSYALKGEKRYYSEPVAYERDVLPAVYNGLVRAVRKQDRKSILFFQVSNYWTVAQTTAAKIHMPVKFSSDPNLGLSFHYGPTDTKSWSSAALAEQARATFAAAADHARRNDSAFMLTGYRLGDDDAQYAAMTDMLGGQFYSWNYYTFKGMPESPKASLLLDPAAPASETNIKAQRIDAMVVPYPQLVAGTPKLWSFDRSTREMRFSYSTRPVGQKAPCAAAATEIFIPARHYPQGYSAAVTGAVIASAPTSAWLVLKPVRGARIVSVVVRPAVGSHTDRPTTALGPTATAVCS